MTRLFALSALIPALMTSTALAADVLAEPVVVEDVPIYTLTGSFGLGGFWMPEFDDGLFAGGTDDPLFGGIATVSGSVTTGTYNDWDIILGFNLIGGFASDDSSSSQSFGGQGTVFISGLSTPGGDSSIQLDIDDNEASAHITAPANGGLAHVSKDGDGNDIVSAATVVPGSTGFLLGAVAITDTTEMAAGAIADASGGIFVVTGDLDGLEVTTNTSRDLFYTGADLTIGLGNASYGGAAVSVYTGPSYRGLFQSTKTDVTIDLPEVDDVVILPGFTISSDEDLNSHYFGGILGGTASWGIGTGMIFSVGLEGGVYGVSASWKGRDTYSTGGGNFDDPYDVPNAGVIPQDPDSVKGLDLKLDDIDDGTIAFAARGNAAITWAVSENQAVSLGGSLEYLSQVATVTHDRVLEDGGGDAYWEAGDGPTGAPSVSWGSMVNFAITASWTGTF